MLKTASSSSIAGGTTGTGSVVLQDGPTINNPTLTGNVSANVNLRSDTLANLLSLSAGSSEIGYATDYNTLVKFNGVAGGAKVLGSYNNGTTLNFLLNDASYTNNQTNPIDCTNVSYLNIIYDNPTVALANINIKLPSSKLEPTLTVQFLSSNIVFGTGVPQLGTITLTYNSYDITNATNVYLPISADNGGTIPTLVVDSSLKTDPIFVFYPIPGSGWTRTSYIGQAYVNSSLSLDLSGYSSALGRYIQNVGLTNNTNLTSNAVTNLGTIALPIGVWIISGKIEFKSNNAVALTMTEYYAQLCSTSSSVITITDAGAVRERAVSTTLANTQILSFTLPTIVLQNTTTSAVTYYNLVQAIFSSGQVIATIRYNAIRIA
jgi:hypothetical protein